ncbi:hypothetical protein NQ314_015011 [Rhamnusium bicolor]|uniref:ZAD domain-containing protein n=1 Tax=Rhamnusium bicolor TaxID=1586634 RepID=A0AAV8X050_9CUCU|nr:hypothetical protein NQ314_015011 [Rhamnusium bicolor]
MDVKKENVCRLCLKCEDDTFSPLDATSKENLKIVVPELNLDGSTNSVICSKCKDTLEESRKIKKISIETDQFIRTQIAEQKIKDKVNLNHIINKTSGEANSNANSETVNICRICLKNKEVNYMNINKAKTDSLFRSALETCLSELDLELTADPVICELCHNTLRELFSFKTGCLSVEEKVKRYCETTSEEEPDLNNVLTFLKADSKKCLGEDNFLSEFEVQDEEEADIFDIFPNFSGEEFKSTNENNEAIQYEIPGNLKSVKKRPSTEDSNVPAKKPKAINSKNVEPKAEDDLPFFSFNFNLIFNPKTEGTMEEWLSKVDELKVKFGWSDYITIHKVLVKLKGMDELYTWFSNISEIMTWEEWKKKLLQMFPVTNDYFVTLKRMINRKKRANETFIEYYNAKLQLLQDMNITGEKAVSCLIGGVTDIAVGCIARVGNYKTPEELLEYFKSCNDKKPVRVHLSEKRTTTKLKVLQKINPLSKVVQIKKRRRKNSSVTLAANMDTHRKNVGKPLKLSPMELQIILNRQHRTLRDLIKGQEDKKRDVLNAERLGMEIGLVLPIELPPCHKLKKCNLRKQELDNRLHQMVGHDARDCMDYSGRTFRN